MATSSAVQPVPLTPAQGEHRVHFSPEPLHEPSGLRHRYGHQSDLDDPFTGPGGSTEIFSNTRHQFTQVCFYFSFFIIFT